MSSMISAFEFLAQTPAPGGQPPWYVQIAPMVLLFGAMYFFMIAPQRKKQKAHEQMLKELSSGDEVVTTGGIFGTITNVKDDRFVIRVSDNTKIEVGKAFVQTVINKTGANEKK